MNLIHINPAVFTIDTTSDHLIHAHFKQGGRSEKVVITNVDRIAFTLLTRRLSQLTVQNDSQKSATNSCIQSDGYADELVNKFLYELDPEQIWNYRMGQESRWAEMMLQFLKLNPFTITIVSMQDLGFNPQQKSLDIKLPEIKKRAFSLGLTYCPQALGVAFKFYDVSIPSGAHITLASEPIYGNETDTKHFSLHGRPDGTYLSRDHSLDTDCRLSEIRDDGGEIFFSGKNIGLPSPSQFGFVFMVPHGSDIVLPKPETSEAIQDGKTTLSQLLQSQSLEGGFPFRAPEEHREVHNLSCDYE